MDHWHKSYKAMLEQLLVQQRTLLERMRVESEQLEKLQKTKNTIDSDIAKLEASLNACSDARVQLEATITSAQAGYKQMVESGNTLLQLANRSIEGLKNIQSLPSALISHSIHTLPPQPIITHREDLETNAGQDVSKEIDIAVQINHPVREQFSWYDNDYYNNL
jgi:predicted  nucleic acid-binding Zn-ribbon protein